MPLRPSASASTVMSRTSRQVSPEASVGVPSSGTREAASAACTSGVGAERARLLAQDQVVAPARGGRRPHALVVLGARRLVVEVHRAGVAAGQQRVHHPERAARVARAEPQVLVYWGPCCPFRSMWNSLPCHSAWAMPCA